jgi:hypothetical protein
MFSRQKESSMKREQWVVVRDTTGGGNILQEPHGATIQETFLIVTAVKTSNVTKH